MDMRTTAGALGVLATGTLDQETLHSLLGALARYGRPEECYELVCHPAFHDAELDRQSTRLRAQRGGRACRPSGGHPRLRSVQARGSTV